MRGKSKTRHAPACRGARMRAPPVADEASIKRGPRSKKSRKSALCARRFFRAPQPDDSYCPCQRKKHLLSQVLFPFIRAAGLAYHRRAKRGVYHQPLRGCISSRASVHLTCGLMICNSYGIDDIHAFSVIRIRECGRFLNYFALPS